MLWASMPKAAVNENSESLFSKYEVWITKEADMTPPTSNMVNPKQTDK
jgi:hypothetical protein